MFSAHRNMVEEKAKQAGCERECETCTSAGGTWTEHPSYTQGGPR